jgi:hypothetical protein
MRNRYYYENYDKFLLVRNTIRNNSDKAHLVPTTDLVRGHELSSPYKMPYVQTLWQDIRDSAN